MGQPGPVPAESTRWGVVAQLWAFGEQVAPIYMPLALAASGNGMAPIGLACRRPCRGAVQPRYGAAARMTSGHFCGCLDTIEPTDVANTDWNCCYQSRAGPGARTECPPARALPLQSSLGVCMQGAADQIRWNRGGGNQRRARAPFVARRVKVGGGGVEPTADVGVKADAVHEIVERAS